MQLLVQRIRTLGPSLTGRRLIATTFWSVVAEALSRGLLMLSMVLVGRMLGTALYGEFGMIRSTINVFVTVGGMGLGLTANRFVAQYRDKDKAYSGHIIGSTYVVAAISGLVVGLCVFLSARLIAVRMLHAPQLEPGLQIAALLLLLGALNGAQIGILQGLEAYRRLALGSLTQGLTALACLVGGAHYFGLQGAVGGLLVYTVVGAIVMQWLIRSELRRQEIVVVYTDFAATLPIFWRFSLPVMLAGVAIAPLKWLAEMMLVRTVGFAELGVFTASMTIANMIIAVVSTVNAPLISLAANAEGSPSGSRIQFASLYGSWYVLLLIALPLILFPRLTGMLFGDKYASPQFFIVNLLLLGYVGLMMYYHGILRAVALRGSMWFGLVTNLFEGGTLLAGFYLFASRGAVGLALAYVLSYVVRIVISLPHLTRGHVVPNRLLYDKYFLGTLLLLGVLITAQIRRLL